MEAGAAVLAVAWRARAVEAWACDEPSRLLVALGHARVGVGAVVEAVVEAVDLILEAALASTGGGRRLQGSVALVWLLQVASCR